MVSTVVKHVSIVSCISSNASSSFSSSSSSFSFDPADAAERVKEYIGVRLQMIVCYIFCYHLLSTFNLLPCIFGVYGSVSGDLYTSRPSSTFTSKHSEILTCAWQLCG